MVKKAKKSYKMTSKYFWMLLDEILGFLVGHCIQGLKAQKAKKLSF
jgi:hypothetical protein